MAYLILIFYLILSVCFILYDSENLKEAFLRSYLILFGLTVVTTEFLSVFEMITFPVILGIWIGFCVIAAGWLVYLYLKSKKSLASIFKNHVCRLKDLSWLNKLALMVILLILVITLIIAISAPPNNFDSLTYHMARVSHWIQQQSVKYYPTSIERQNYAQPLTEYMILHLQMLSRSDLYANLVQWSGFVIAILAAGEIGRLFKTSRTGQIFAALFTATLPMAILQSSSTQTDIMAGVFCLIFIYYLIQGTKIFNWKMILLGGLSLGLAILAKGTAYIYGAALGLIFGGASLIKADKSVRNTLLRGFAVLVLVALIMNAGIYYRNNQLYSHPIFAETDRITNDKTSIGVLYANLIRNGALQVAGPFPEFNRNITAAIASHLGSAVSDPDSTFSGSSFKVLYRINEDEASSPLHFWFLVGVFCLILWRKKQFGVDSILFGLAIIACVVLFSLAFKWQPWGSRLLLPVYLFAAPLVGMALDKINHPRLLIWIVFLVFSVASIPYLTLNETRPLVPIFRKNSPFRSNQIRRYFSDRPELYEEYKKIISPFYLDQSVLRTDRQIQYFSSTSSQYQDYQVVMEKINQLDIASVGLHLGSNDLEYPIWVLSNQHAEPGTPAFRHVDVVGMSKNLEPGEVELPNYVLSTRMLEDGSINGVKFSIILDTPTIDLLER